MSLDWNISRIKDRETVCFQGKGKDRRLKPETKILIFATLSVGLGDITEKNLEEWRYRFAVLDRINSHVGNMKGKGFNPTAEQLRAHVGLSTNVFPAVPRKKWLNNVRDMIDRDARAAVRDSKEIPESTDIRP